VYFLNVGFNFIKLPAFFTDINRWIVVVGGVFLIFGGFNFLKTRRTTPR
jgi:cytochrome c biogenesis protein CcdA